MTETWERTEMNFNGVEVCFNTHCNWVRAKTCKIIIMMWFVCGAPLTFHGDQAGVRQQRQGEQKQEIHHWQTIVAEQRSWGAEERTRTLQMFDRNGLH